MKARVGAVSPVLFKSGEGCGACYKVRCLDHGVCSRRAVTVIVTDECPGGVCAGGRTHFDLSGAAFGRLAVAGAGGQLRDRGEINVVFRRYDRRSTCMQLQCTHLFLLPHSMLYYVRRERRMGAVVVNRIGRGRGRRRTACQHASSAVTRNADALDSVKTKEILQYCCILPGRPAVVPP